MIFMPEIQTEMVSFKNGTRGEYFRAFCRHLWYWDNNIKITCPTTSPTQMVEIHLDRSRGFNLKDRNAP